MSWQVVSNHISAMRISRGLSIAVLVITLFLYSHVCKHASLQSLTTLHKSFHAAPAPEPSHKDPGHPKPQMAKALENTSHLKRPGTMGLQ